jgi:hypothetical protein
MYDGELVIGTVSSSDKTFCRQYVMWTLHVCASICYAVWYYMLRI